MCRSSRPDPSTPWPPVAWAALLLGLACDQANAGSVGTGDPVDMAVDCSFSFDGSRTDVSYDPADDRTETPVGGKLIASGMLSDDEYEGRSFSLTIYAEDSTVLATAIYQMARDSLPANEFHGDHGFTGLNWVKDPDLQENVQYACFARTRSDPPHFWDE